MSSSHFGKKQSTLLIATIFYKNDDKKNCKLYYDFVSEYLGHNSAFYEKCMGILIEEIRNKLNLSIDAIYNITDGRNHFVSRYAYWSLGKYARYYGLKNNPNFD